MLVDVLTQGGRGLADLAVHGELEEVGELVASQSLIDEVELHRSLLDPLGEVVLVEREPQLSVLQDIVGAGVVVPSACCLLHSLRIPAPI